MKRLQFDIHIAAPRSQVAAAMLAPASFTEWTSAFGENSRYEGSWEPGSRIRFLGAEGEGMVAEIAEHQPARFLSIRHLGLFHQGQEDTQSEAVRDWAPCHEDYHWTDAPDGGTQLSVRMDCVPAWEAFMTERWPLALARLKSLCESPSTP